MFGKKLETGMWGQREQQQIKKKKLKEKKDALERSVRW